MASSYNYGDLASVISSEGYRVVYVAETSMESGTQQAAVKGMANVMWEASSWLVNNKPDWVVVSGDRPEQLAFAITASFLYLPVAHIQAGEKSGNIDDLSRNAIARFAHLHFASNTDALNRLSRSGEQSFRIVLTGAPQLDDIHRQFFSGKESPGASTRRRQVGDYCLAVFHAATEEQGSDEIHLQNIISALKGLRTVWIAPNNDPNSRRFLDLIRRSLGVGDELHTNLPREEYLSLLAECQFLIGNSSSGILEAPSFGTPVINVGHRQNGRLRSKNIIDVDGSLEQMVLAVKKAQSASFRDLASSAQNPFGSGSSSSLIVDTLEATKPSVSFLVKEMEY